MSKISCNVIQDIMPLYVDEIVSEDIKFLLNRQYPAANVKTAEKKWKKCGQK